MLERGGGDILERGEEIYTGERIETRWRVEERHSGGEIYGESGAERHCAEWRRYMVERDMLESREEIETCYKE